MGLCNHQIIPTKVKSDGLQLSGIWLTLLFRRLGNGMKREQDVVQTYKVTVRALSFDLSVCQHIFALIFHRLVRSNSYGIRC